MHFVKYLAVVQYSSLFENVIIDIFSRMIYKKLASD